MDERDYKAMNKDKSTIGFEPVLAPVCNCIVGYLDGKETNKSNLIERLKSLSAFMPTYKNYGLMKGKCLTPREIADGRKGYLQRHNYCPKCGIKLNWNELLNGC